MFIPPITINVPIIIIAQVKIDTQIALCPAKINFISINHIANIVIIRPIIAFTPFFPPTKIILIKKIITNKYIYTERTTPSTVGTIFPFASVSKLTVTVSPFLSSYASILPSIS